MCEYLQINPSVDDDSEPQLGLIECTALVSNVSINGPSRLQYPRELASLGGPIIDGPVQSQAVEGNVAQKAHRYKEAVIAVVFCSSISLHYY
jgi:hypothetical protein